MKQPAKQPPLSAKQQQIVVFLEMDERSYISKTYRGEYMMCAGNGDVKERVSSVTVKAMLNKKFLVTNSRGEKIRLNKNL